MSTISITSPVHPGANGKSLEIVGFAFGAVTVAVVMIAAALVQAHLGGRLAFDDTSRQAVTITSAKLGR